MIRPKITHYFKSYDSSQPYHAKTSRLQRGVADMAVLDRCALCTAASAAVGRYMAVLTGPRESNSFI